MSSKSAVSPTSRRSIGPNSKGEPGPLSALNNYLALTYLPVLSGYGASPVAAPDPDVERFREGQWEAVTIFLKGNPDFGTTDPQGRPDFPFTIVYRNRQQGSALSNCKA